MPSWGYGGILAIKNKSSNFWLGWDGRIRTYDLLVQSEAPYHLATSH